MALRCDTRVQHARAVTSDNVATSAVANVAVVAVAIAVGLHLQVLQGCSVVVAGPRFAGVCRQILDLHRNVPQQLFIDYEVINNQFVHQIDIVYNGAYLLASSCCW